MGEEGKGPGLIKLITPDKQAQKHKELGGLVPGYYRSFQKSGLFIKEKNSGEVETFRGKGFVSIKIGGGGKQRPMWPGDPLTWEAKKVYLRF